MQATFLPNLGQWPFPARYVARLGPIHYFFEDRGWVFTIEEGASTEFDPTSMDLIEPDQEEQALQGVALRMSFEGASEEPDLQPGDETSTLYHFFLGNDPARWRSHVKGHGTLTYKDLYPGIDLELRRSELGIRYDLLLQPGADIEAVLIHVEGSDGLRLASDGSLVIDTCLGPVLQSAPRTWEVLPDGSKRPLHSGFILKSEDRFGFNVEGRSPLLAMVVDPEIVWSTFLGGSNGDSVWTHPVEDSSGNIVVGGYTRSLDYPTTVGAYSRIYQGLVAGYIGDAIVSKLSADGTRMLWSTFLGGTDGEVVVGLAIEPSGRVTIAGPTSSANFPVTPGAYQTIHLSPGTAPSGYIPGYGGDVFVSRLESDGSRLIWSTFVGGDRTDFCYGLALARNGDVFVGGSTNHHYQYVNFPATPGAFMEKEPSPYAWGTLMGYIFRLSNQGDRLVWSTYLGGERENSIRFLTVTPGEDVAVTGITRSTRFPVTSGAFMSTYPGQYHNYTGFVSVVDGASGSKLLASTYLGGKGFERNYSIACYPDGDLVVAGNTLIDGFPVTPGAFDTIPDMSAPPGVREPGKGFIARLSPDLKSLRWGTYFGGSSADSVKAIALAPSGEIHFAGITRSLDLPTTPGAPFSIYQKSGDIFYGCLSSDGRRLLAATYLGGSQHVNAIGIAFGPSGLATVAGDTTSANFPTTPGVFGPTYFGHDGQAADGDAFVTRFASTFKGVRRFGSDTPSCLGAVTIYPELPPRSGEQKFGFTCWKTPPSSAGLLMIGAKGLPGPLRALGIDFWIDPVASPFITVGALSDAKGRATVPLPLPPGIQGAQVNAQFLWLNTPACPGSGPLSASDALEITVQ